VRPLERDGLLNVEVGEDGRVRMMKLTRAGSKRLDDADAQWRKAQVDIESAFGAKSAADLRTTLGRLVDVTARD
jgi:DNA-binding MarR family transcriptional regulator